MFAFLLLRVGLDRWHIHLATPTGLAVRFGEFVVDHGTLQHCILSRLDYSHVRDPAEMHPE